MAIKYLRRPDVVHFGILSVGGVVTMRCGATTNLKKDNPPLKYSGFHSAITCDSCSP